MNRFVLLFLLALFICAPAHATRTVTSPYVDEGVLKLKWKGGYTHDDERESRDGAHSHRLAAEYGVSKKLSLEAEGNVENPGGDDNTDVTALSLKAKILLTEKGRYWLDAGTRLTYETALNDDPDSVELKFIMAKDTEKFRHIANFILTRQAGHDASDDTSGGFSWSSRYKFRPEFEPGFEMYNNFGSLSDRPGFEEQDHSIGPVIYGKITDHIKYEAGYLAGFSGNAADGRFKGVIEYAIKF